jgi:hypothetical protein
VLPPGARLCTGFCGQTSHLLLTQPKMAYCDVLCSLFPFLEKHVKPINQLKSLSCINASSMRSQSVISTYIYTHTHTHTHHTHTYICLGHALAQWLRDYPTNQKVAESIPDGVIGILHLTLSFRPHYGPGVDSASNGNEYKEYSLEVKAAGA